MLPNSDQKIVRNIVSSSGSSFYWGMKILEEKQRRAMFAIYSFCRIIDDIADSDKKLSIKIKGINLWKLKIDNLFKGKTDDSVTRELLFSVESFSLQKSDFLKILEGMLMDACQNIVYPKKEFLIKYCDNVAGSVGCLSVKVFGLTNYITSRKYATNLGRAFQLTNIIRDLNEDVNRGRCYISENYLKKVGLKKIPLKNLIDSKKIDILCQEVLNDAKEYYAMAEKYAKELEKTKLKASELIKDFYTCIFYKMYNKNWNKKKRVRLNLFEKIFLIIKSMIGDKN